MPTYQNTLTLHCEHMTQLEQSAAQLTHVNVVNEKANRQEDGDVKALEENTNELADLKKEIRAKNQKENTDELAELKKEIELAKLRKELEALKKGGSQDDDPDQITRVYGGTVELKSF